MPRQGGVREKENNDVEEIAYDYNLPEINQRYNNNMRERAIGDGSIVHALAYRFSSSSLSLS